MSRRLSKSVPNRDDAFGSQGIGAALLLVAAVILSYLPALGSDFVWDDSTLLLNNPAITLPGHWASIWTGEATPDYFPLTYSLLKLCWILWGGWAPGFHGLNIVLHLAGVLLLWRLLLQLEVPGAWWGTALFAVHPVNVATVAWVSEIKNTLSLTLALGASLLFLSRCVQEDRLRRDLAALVLFIAALLAKTSVVLLPCVWTAVLWWKMEFPSRKVVLRIVPFLAIALGAGLLTLWFQTHRVIHHEFASISPGWIPELIRGGWGIGFYLRQLVWPDSLSMLYGNRHPEEAISGSWMALTAAVTVTLLTLRHHRINEWGRGWEAAFSCYLLLLLPVMGFLPMYYLRLAPVADHWLYLPAIPLFAFAGAGVAGGKQGLRLAAGSLVVILFGVLTWNRCHELLDAVTLWNSVLKRDPGSVPALQNLALALDKEGDSRGAVLLARRAVTLAPADLEPRLNLAGLLGKHGDIPAALEVLRSTMTQWPDSADLFTMEGDLLSMGGRKEEALLSYQKAAGMNPKFVRALMGIGKLEFLLGRPSLAIPPLETLLDLDPQSTQAINILGASHATLGHNAEAEALFLRGLQIDPSNIHLRNNLRLLKQPEALLQH